MSALPVTVLPAQVLVLGMHRSGTSVLTHLLVRMGCHPGPAESLQPGDAANPDGYWEHRSAWALDEEILAALGASWWEVADLDPGALPAAQRAELTRRAGALVAELDTRRPWVLKDPRLCVLLPLWRPALDEPAFVLVHRDPLEVARSLQARDGFPLAVGLALWEVYTLAALRHSLGAPRLLVGYQRLLRGAGRGGAGGGGGPRSARARGPARAGRRCAGDGGQSAPAPATRCPR